MRRPHAETLAAQVWTGSFEGLDLERTWSARDRSVEDQALDSVSAATLREKLDALPAAERAVVVGRLEGKTHAAIGEELGVQASTTRKRLVNARERLEKLLDIPAENQASFCRRARENFATIYGSEKVTHLDVLSALRDLSQS